MSMTPELQKRTGLGLLLLLAGYAVELVLPHVSSAVAAQLADGSRPGGASIAFSLASTLTNLVIVLVQGAGLVLLLRRMGSYAQFALASLCAFFGVSLMKIVPALAQLLRSPSGSFSYSNAYTMYGATSLASSVLFVLCTVAALLLLRRATTAAGATPSLLATLVIAASLAFNFLRVVAYSVAIARLPVSSLAAINYAGMAVHAVMCIAFMWLAFRARSATLGMLLGGESTTREAYR